MSYSLKDRNVLVTGGSRYISLLVIPTTKLTLLNRGLGALVAQRFASEGSNIAINYASSKDAAEKLASEIQSQFGVKTITIQGVRVSSTLSEYTSADLVKNRTQVSQMTVSNPSRQPLSNWVGWILWYLTP